MLSDVIVLPCATLESMYCLVTNPLESVIAGSFAEVPSEKVRLKTAISSRRGGTSGCFHSGRGTVEGSFSTVMPP